MAKQTEWYAIIRYRALDELTQTQGLSHVLDMLRYDRSTVEGIQEGYVILRASRPHTVDRWRSFGITVEAQEPNWGAALSTVRKLAGVAA